jgi:hypothetical protein
MTIEVVLSFECRLAHWAFEGTFICKQEFRIRFRLYIHYTLFILYTIHENERLIQKEHFTIMHDYVSAKVFFISKTFFALVTAKNSFDLTFFDY